MENLKLEDLSLSFMDISSLAGQEVSSVDANETGLQFGPSKQQAKSYSNWDGCDGKFFFPYSKRDKVGKISDFVTAASNALKEKERELDRIEALKRIEAAQIASGQKVVEKKKDKKKTFEAIVEDDEDMGFQTVEDKTTKFKRDQNKNQKWKNN